MLVVAAPETDQRKLTRQFDQPVDHLFESPRRRVEAGFIAHRRCVKQDIATGAQADQKLSADGIDSQGIDGFAAVAFTHTAGRALFEDLAHPVAAVVDEDGKDIVDFRNQFVGIRHPGQQLTRAMIRQMGGFSGLGNESRGLIDR
jgi:hypothetical protein